MNTMKITLRSIGLLGIILFGGFFGITFLSPSALEESAKGFVKKQIEKEVRYAYEEGINSNIADKAQSIADKLGIEKEQLQVNLNNDLPEKIAAVIASLCGYDCEKKKALAQSISASYLERIQNIEIAQDTLGNLIKNKYLYVVEKLTLDLRIFLGANLLMFLLLFCVSLFKPQAIVHLFLPALLLLAATLVSSAIYLFGQDWFYTILYNDYMGFGYLAYVGVIFAGLIDIVLNKARVTTEVINGIANAIGSAFSVVSC